MQKFPSIAIKALKYEYATTTFVAKSGRIMRRRREVDEISAATPLMEYDAPPVRWNMTQHPSDGR